MPQNPRRKTLFGQIMLWMIVPLALLWPFSLLMNYHLGRAIANSPYDRALTSQVVQLSRQVAASSAHARPLQDQLVLPFTVDDTPLLFQIQPYAGELLMGSRELPAPPAADELALNQVDVYDGQINGESVRVAYMWLDASSVQTDKTSAAPSLILIQVAEKLDARNRMAREILQGVVLPQIVFLPIAVLLIWFGLTRGILPLSRVQDQIQARSQFDISDLSTEQIPEEMESLITSFNHVLARLRRHIAFQKRFLTDTAHQIKTPLAGLKAQAELALQTADPLEQRKSLRQIAAASERTAHLVSQLIALARTEHLAEQQIELQPVELIQAARNQMMLAADHALQKKLELSFEAPDYEIWIQAHPMLLGELLKNLIDNAIFYTSSSVVVRLSRQQDAAVFEVIDDGVGIAVDERDAVFAPFYSVLGEQSKGSGLGLAIVKQIAEIHDAHIHVHANHQLPDNAHMLGCVFDVRFLCIPKPR